MKKALLLTITAGITFGAFAQSSSKFQAKLADKQHSTTVATHSPLAKTTAVSYDTIAMANISSSDTATLYYVSMSGAAQDSGYFSGMNFAGWNAFAERFDFNPVDSSVQVLGMFGYFGGTVNPASLNTITMKVWSQGAPQEVSSTMSFNGLPGSVLDSVVVADTALGVTDTTWGTRIKLFATPTSFLTDSFFVGYSMNYTWGATNGDTLALATTRSGHRHFSIYTTSGSDTIINNKNAYMSGGVWKDYAYSQSFAMDFYIYPIIIAKKFNLAAPVITKNDFSFYGTYPNPASNNTNVKFGLANAMEVTVTVMDMSGRTMSTTKVNGAAGENVVNVSTAGLASGDYLMFVRTATNNGLASQFSVIK